MIVKRLGAIGACAVCATVVSFAQIGKIVQQDWVTSRGDAQRTSWIRGDVSISADAMQGSRFKLQWKTSLDNQPRQLNALNSGVVIGNLGFGSVPLSFVTGSANRVFAVDNDTGTVVWQRTFENGAATGTGTIVCPGGMTSAATRPGSVLPNIPGPARGPQIRPAYSSGVGAPGEGVPAYLMGRGRAAPAPAPTTATRGAAPPPAPAAPPSPPVVYVLSSDGQLHTLGLYTGKDVVRPLSFLPANALASDLIALNNVVYATTMHGCGGAPDGVWALDLTRETAAMKMWSTEGGSPIGAPAFGSDGTLYVALGVRTAGTGGYSNAVVALDPKGLTVKDWFTQTGSELVTPPVILKVGDTETIAVATADGSIVLLDAASLGGQAHNTPRARSAAAAGDVSGFIASGIATWSDATGTAWVLVPRSTTLSAFKVTLTNGAASIQPGWTSRQMRAPIAPLVVNGVVFVVSSGEFVPATAAPMTAADRIRRSMPAVLYALDGTTGRELWSSGNTMTSFVHGPAIWPGIGQIHVATFDGTVYAFGFPLERY